MQNHPLNKVVFIQRIAAFIKTSSLKDLFQLAYVNNSWNDTIKNYCFHLFEKRVCAIGSASNRTELESFCADVIKCDVTWFVDVLMSSKTLLHRINVPILVCQNRAPSIAVMRLVFEKIVEVGGNELLQRQLNASQLINKYASNCLMLGCRNFSSPEAMKMLFEKILEAGGKEFLINQLTTTTGSGLTSIMLGCIDSSSPTVMQLVCEKMVEVGGKELLLSQITATDISRSTCLMHGCARSASPEVMKLIFAKIVEVGGIEMLESQITAKNAYNSTCILMGCYNSASSEIIKFAAACLYHLDIFKQEYAKLDHVARMNLAAQGVIEDDYWVPDRVSIAEVKKMVKC